MYEIAQDVFPIFILILFGWGLVKTRILNADIGDGLGEFVFKVAVPVLLFRTISHADFHGASPFRLWIAYFSGVAVTWALGHFLATRFFGRDARVGVLAGVSSAFANNIFIGLPLVERTVGSDGIVAVSILLAVHLPLMMVIGTVLMERAEHKVNGGEARGLVNVLRQVGTNLVRNPLIIGLAAGLVVHVSGLEFPGVLASVVDQITAMAAPAALISLGMALNKYGINGNVRIAVVVTSLKLLVMPACVWLACRALGLSADWTAALVLTSSVPTGINAWLIANRFGVGHGLAASAISLSTAVGVLSVTLWAWILQ
ncbi:MULTISPECIES: AEC family transporter [Alphaproteobacteria]|uniref:Permease n=2 Tax=Alphaproteobacteria TaxID=28211 RepID=A0A512HIT3_9HYPH|nr:MULTISPECIES: AEC family transporter [Alphaproteobacteria]GEO85347.1 permease [Ciceribacter naphthalenivorans]GLR20986.1 permease [Ciceribacter naphthalenivorans]GLT03842.1 permease [Sphingomonas psychrolutea]